MIFLEWAVLGLLAWALLAAVAFGVYVVVEHA